MERMVHMCNLPEVIGVLFTLCPVTFGGGAFSGITFIILILSFKRSVTSPVILRDFLPLSTTLVMAQNVSKLSGYLGRQNQKETIE
ncbi:MAG: hypothetical protein QY315_14695 [Saprospiraceae bacterium]|nr:MAG: hypothetical protein QY315_14695 [Saprospiraceae bacterium]